MVKNHSTRSASSNKKGNASPFAVGAPAGKKNSKAPAASNLPAVSTDAFYNAKVASSSTRSKIKPTSRPEDLPSPTNQSTNSSSKCMRSDQSNQEVIAIADESEEEIEDVGNVTEVQVTENGRSSMAPPGSYRRSYQMTGNPTSETPQIVQQTGSKPQAKSRAAGGNVNSVGLCPFVSGSYDC